MDDKILKEWIDFARTAIKNLRFGIDEGERIAKELEQETSELDKLQTILWRIVGWKKDLESWERQLAEFEAELEAR